MLQGAVYFARGGRGLRPSQFPRVQCLGEGTFPLCRAFCQSGHATEVWRIFEEPTLFVIRLERTEGHSRQGSHIACQRCKHSWHIANAHYGISLVVDRINQVHSECQYSISVCMQVVLIL